jgi:RHS repeat-associated protein
LADPTQHRLISHRSNVRIDSVGVCVGNDRVEYAYLTNSPLIETITFKRNGVAVMTTTKTHDQVNRLAQTLTTVGVNPVSGHAYTLNSLNQRTHAEEMDGTYWSYQYNSKGEVVNGTKHDAGDNPLAGMNLGYSFDGIGNRTATTVDAVADTAYTANKLNQYTEINQGAAVNPVHDDDGNLVDDGTLLLAWDGEPRRPAEAEMDGRRQPEGRDEREARASQNRLKTVHRKSDNALIATYTYDDLSRRVRKQTTTDAPQGAQDRVSVWDGWNKVAELAHNAGTFTAVRYHTWGLDLSGSEQGAGGVGGMVMQQEAVSGDVYYPSYDGNGNVIHMVKASDGSVAASYAYDPFGKLTTSSGVYADTNEHRFSTKPIDEETGWYYYGFRYYQPTTGRWLNRDPIGERGGLNLYGMVGNDPVNKRDYLGLEESITPENSFHYKPDILRELTATERGQGHTAGHASPKEFMIKLKWEETKRMIIMESASARFEPAWHKGDSMTQRHEMNHVEDGWQIWQIAHRHSKWFVNIGCSTKEEFECYNKAFNKLNESWLKSFIALSTGRHSNPTDLIMVYSDRDVGQNQAQQADRHNQSTAQLLEAFRAALTTYTVCNAKYKDMPLTNAVTKSVKVEAEKFRRELSEILKAKGAFRRFTFPGAVAP